MATGLINFPLALVTDGLISYLQHVFSSPEHTPSEYRWNANDRSSRIVFGKDKFLQNIFFFNYRGFYGFTSIIPGRYFSKFLKMGYRQSLILVYTICFQKSGIYVFIKESAEWHIHCLQKREYVKT